MTAQDKAAAYAKATKAMYAAAKKWGYDSRQFQQANAKCVALLGG
jgi:hypothetical protein